MGFEKFFETHIIADWLLNIFLTLSPMALGLLTIWISDKNSKRQSMLHKKVEIKISHLQDCIFFLNELLDEIFNCAAYPSNFVLKDDARERVKVHHEMLGRTNRLMQSFLSKYKYYVHMNNVLQIDLEMDSLRVAIGNYNEELIGMCEKYNGKKYDEGIYDLVNASTNKIRGEINERIEIIGKELNELLNRNNM